MKKNISPFLEEDLDKDLGFLMLRVSHLWEASHEKALTNYTIKHIDFTILASVYWLNLHNTSDVTQIMLSKHTKIPPMTVSQTLKSLEYKGYLSRTVSASDLRAKSCVLTQTGTELVQKAFTSVIVADTRFFSPLTGVHRKNFNKYMVELFHGNE